MSLCLWCLLDGTHVPGCMALLHPIYERTIPEPRPPLTAQDVRDGLTVLQAQDPELHAALTELGAVGPTLCHGPDANVRFAKLTIRVQRCVVAMVLREHPAGNGAGHITKL